MLPVLNWFYLRGNVILRRTHSPSLSADRRSGRVPGAFVRQIFWSCSRCCGGVCLFVHPHSCGVCGSGYHGDSQWSCPLGRGGWSHLHFCVSGSKFDIENNRNFSVSLPLFLITLAVPGGFGGGDIKLMAACGLFLGWKLCLLSLCFGLLTGGLYGIWLLAAGKKGRKEHFAFGPFYAWA